MAKQPTTEAPEQRTPEARFSVKHCLPNFTGDECGVKFAAGYGYTDNAMFAHALVQEGNDVKERGGPCFGNDDPESMKRIAARAEERRAAEAAAKK